MRLSELLERAGIHRRPRPDPEVTGVEHNSKRVKGDDLFVCIEGQRFDGHDFASEAVAKGACAVVAKEGKRLPEEVEAKVPIVFVPDTREALARLSAAFFGFPSRNLLLAGITGTNGKTTVVELLRSIFESAGLKAARMGTLGYKCPWGEGKLSHTTPEAPDLQRALREFADRGVEAVAMEVSSHSLELKRVVGCRFKVAGFTNLSQDHLDFHPSMEAYGEAKMRLFTQPLDDEASLPLTATNLDDEWGRRIAEATRGRCLTYGASPEAELRFEVLERSGRGLRLLLRQGREACEVEMKLIAPFNAHNAACAAAVARLCGIEWEAIKRGLEAVRLIPGRFELIECGQPFMVAVDYAHTPDSLRKVLEAAREMAEGKVIVVFGCGGDRDPFKRPKMGRVAAKLADFVVVTNDNPRSERPEDIASAIERGILEVEGANYEVILDRATAIRFALQRAAPGDVVVVAGKGHETYQIIGDRTIPFDDREECRRALGEMGYA